MPVTMHDALHSTAANPAQRSCNARGEGQTATPAATELRLADAGEIRKRRDAGPGEKMLQIF